MMHGHEKSDPAIVAAKPANKAAPPCCGAIRGGTSRSEAGGGQGGDQGKCGPAKHALNSAPGSCGTTPERAGRHREVVGLPQCFGCSRPRNAK